MKRKALRLIVILSLAIAGSQLLFLSLLTPFRHQHVEHIIESLFFVLSAVIFLVVLFHFAMKVLIERAESICTGLERIQGGNYSADIQLEEIKGLFKGEDELDRIANGINRMQLEVAKREQQLLFKQESMEGILQILTQQSDELKLNYDIYRIIGEETNDGMIVIDFRNGLTVQSVKTLRILGYEPEDIGKELANWKQLAPEDQGQAFYDHLLQLVHGESQLLQMEIQLKDASGKLHWFAIRGKSILDDRGTPIMMVGSNTYIETWKKAQESIYRLAYYNQLTQLPNRYAILEALENRIAQCSSENRQFSLLLLNLDRFKRVNDLMGHELGDQLIIKVAERLKETLEPEDFFGHLSADEFVCVLNIRDKTEAQLRIERFLSLFKAAWVLGERSIHATASIGASIFPEDGRVVRELLKKADIALAEAKESGGNCGIFYAPVMDQHLEQKLEIESALRKAVNNQEFHVYYQPKIDSKGEIRGFEALVRWIREDGEVVSPSLFIPSAEENGLIVEIGDFVLQSVCKKIREMRALGSTDLIYSVNLSPIQFEDGRLVEKVRSVLQQYAVPPEQLEFEITESTAMENFNYVNDLLDKFRRMGIRIALDDFGKGFSSLNYLKELHIDTLKVDRDFIRDIGEDLHDTVILDHIISIAHNLNLKVVAEGVEKKGQFRYLVERGCNEYQGFLFSKPVPEGQVETLIFKGISEF